MERILKFRAWEKYDADYAEEMGVSGEMHHSESWPDEEIQDKRTVVISGFYHDSGWSAEDFTIMQFTGLVDKNGKEIYEGDILSWLALGDTERTPVIWDDKDNGGFAAGDTYLRGLEVKEAEVIGNIYENKELLDQPQQ